MKKILIIEDEKELTKVLQSYLEKENYQVKIAFRGDQGLQLWKQEQPDLILLDINLPGMNGLDVAREIRKTSHVPIVMITARVEEADQLIGLEAGADDYLTKPFSPRIVVAKVRAILRRTEALEEEPEILNFGDLLIYVDQFRVEIDHQEIDLTPSEFELLHALASHPGRVFTRLQLLDATQGSSYEGYQRTIDTHIKNLRAKIEPDPKNPAYIETVFGVGYRFSRQSEG